MSSSQGLGIGGRGIFRSTVTLGSAGTRKAPAPSLTPEAVGVSAVEAGSAADTAAGAGVARVFASFNDNFSQGWSVVIFLPSASTQVLRTLADARLKMLNRKIDIKIFIS